MHKLIIICWYGFNSNMCLLSSGKQKYVFHRFTHYHLHSLTSKEKMLQTFYSDGSGWLCCDRCPSHSNLWGFVKTGNNIEYTVLCPHSFQWGCCVGAAGCLICRGHWHKNTWLSSIKTVLTFAATQCNIIQYALNHKSLVSSTSNSNMEINMIIGKMLLSSQKWCLRVL